MDHKNLEYFSTIKVLTQRQVLLRLIKVDLVAFYFSFSFLFYFLFIFLFLFLKLRIRAKTHEYKKKSMER